MRRHRVLILGICFAAAACAAVAASAGTFTPAPLAPDQGVDRMNLAVARQRMNRDLFGEPYATVTISNVDLYDRFPYVEARDFQIVSDPRWNRLVFGERGQSLEAFDGAGTTLGPLAGPRGMATDENGRVYVADTEHDRIVVLQADTRFADITLTPLYAIAGLSGPWDVAYSDGGTPFVPGDDVLYVADTGKNRVVAFALDAAGGGARRIAELGGLGSGVGRFAGPLAVAAGRGAHAHDVYVADAHSRRIVRLTLDGATLRWDGAVASGADVVTSLDTDAWGNVYAAAPNQGVVRKWNAALAPVAELRDGLSRPRGFHVPFLTVHDHRDGSVSRVGRPNAVTVDDWASPSGIALWKLGTAVSALAVSGGASPAAEFTLTDDAQVTLDVRDATNGATVAHRAIGPLAAGAHTLALADDLRGAHGADLVVRLTAASSYPDGGGDAAEANLSVTAQGSVLPARAALIGNAPNPGTPGTRIQFVVPAGARHVALSLYDATGRRVRSFSGGFATGMNEIAWDGTDDRGRAVAAGIYLYRLDVDEVSFTRRMALVRSGS
ncbi:MAG: T9SS type A sorting domain-containing protein [Candidatus Eisenbacteria bacterium]|nr:T9SS type A sorting domain-containing protein [Candidatus Eisenbacteria bacterium]